jgi:hypothetical protein
MNYLLGKEIETIDLNYDTITINFKHYPHKVLLIAMSDCCDANYFKEIQPLTNLIGKKILNIEEQKNPQDGGVDDFIYTQIFKINVKLIDEEYLFFRINESNGYYSGRLDIKLCKDNIKALTCRRCHNIFINCI